MAHWFVQAIVGELINRASSYLGGEYDLQSGINDKLARLEASLRRIRIAVDAAERRHIENPGLVAWMRELKDAAYEADDVLDVFEYRLLEQKLITDNEASSFAATSRNAAKRIRRAVTSLVTCDDDAKALTSVVERLNVIASDVGEFLRMLDLDGGLKQPDINSRRITSSLPATRHRVFGREKEREQIIRLLLQSTPGGDGNVSVLPVLGIGGVGKTTLAQLVYNDDAVKDYFSLRMWVCVSDSFDVVALTREISEQAGSDKDRGAANFNRLQVNLQHKLSWERFLLVLDDVWNEEEKRQWETLCSPLKFAKEGSKILVTSRSEKVARLMGTMEPIRLEGLQEEEFLSFFEERAFGCEDPGKHPKLAAIGKEIAKKLKGSPLAAETVGGLLKANLDDDHWESILESRIWELQQGADDIMPVLKLSYDYLPTHLQQCFAYCSIFPKDWNFVPDNLIRLWMANGFIWYKDNGKKRMEDRGMDYFNDLVSRSFFQLFAGAYVMHDLLHDLAESVSRDNCFRIEGDEPRTIPCTIRHLSLTNNYLATLTDQKPSVLKNLRTLLFFWKYNSIIDDVLLQNVFKELRSIRVLSFRRCSLESLPDTIDHFIHLRHLNISATGLRALPDQICRLYHLQYLGMTGLDLFSPPAKMNNLINLQHLTDFSGRIISRITGIGKLTSLQRLPFSVSKLKGFEIGQLKNLRELRSLCIKNLENVESKEDATEANLRDKRNLERLELCWDPSQGNVGPEVEEEVLEGLEPHPHLKELAVVGCRSVRYPSWFLGNHCLLNLVSLKMADHRERTELAPLGQLPYLKCLKITKMHAVEEVGRGFYGTGEVKGFPSLEILKFRDMPNWREWSGVEDVPLFPRLRRLKITDCPKLMAMPALPPNLEDLDINGAGLITLPGLSGGYDNTGFEVFSPCPASSSSSSPSSSSLQRLVINNCPVLKSLGRGLLQQQHHLKNLRQLAIRSCEELESLPVTGLGKLISLTYLAIESCPKLMSLTTDMDREEVGEGRFLLPSSLEVLEFSECGAADMHLSWHMQGLSNLTRLKIKNCWHITHLPTAEVLRQLTALQDLEIENLEELTSVGGLGALVSIKILRVFRCPKLTSALNMRTSLVDEEAEEERLSSLGSLYVDDPLLLEVLLTREGFASLQVLEINGGGRSTCLSLQKMVEIFEQLTSLQRLFIGNWRNLWKLPELKSLSSLKELSIWYCRDLQSLPRKEGLPALLEQLIIVGCHPVLKERYQQGDGSDWHTIAHIPRITIE